MRRFHTISVEQLIEQLQDLQPDALIAFSCDYGDYHHTRQVLPFGEEPEEVIIEESAYSQSGFAISRQEVWEADQDEVDEKDTPVKVYVIRYGRD